MLDFLDKIDIIEETDTYVAYMDDGPMVIEDISDSPLSIEETSVERDDLADPENPALVAYRSLLFDTFYHQRDVREWIL